MARRTSSGTEVLLGLLTIAPMSGYDLGQLIRASIRHFWNESYGQIYPNLPPARRRRFHPAQNRKAKRKPDRQVYSITKKGRERLAQWLSVAPQPEVPRNELLLKIFFGAQPLHKPSSLRRAHARVGTRRTPGFSQIEREIAATPQYPDAPYWQIVVRFGQIELEAAPALGRRNPRHPHKLEKNQLRTNNAQTKTQKGQAPCQQITPSRPQHPCPPQNLHRSPHGAGSSASFSSAPAWSSWVFSPSTPPHPVQRSRSVRQPQQRDSHLPHRHVYGLGPPLLLLGRASITTVAISIPSPAAAGHQARTPLDLAIAVPFSAVVGRRRLCRLPPPRRHRRRRHRENRRQPVASNPARNPDLDRRLRYRRYLRRNGISRIPAAPAPRPLRQHRRRRPRPGHVFGLFHAYQGWRQVVVISVLGILYGILAAWRRNLRINIATHAFTDIWEGWLKFLVLR